MSFSMPMLRTNLNTSPTTVQVIFTNILMLDSFHKGNCNRLHPPQPQTLTPSEQLAQMSIFFLLCSTWLLKLRYSLFCHNCLKLCSLRFPSLCWASLSKQQGTTEPSQVITGSCHKRQQW